GRSATVNVAHQAGAAAGAVGLPELGAIGGGAGAEIEGAVQVEQIAWESTGRAGVNVAKDRGAAAGAVAVPEFVSGSTVRRAKEGAAAGVGEGGRSAGGGAGGEVGDFDGAGAGGGAVATPEFEAVAAVGPEVEPAGEFAEVRLKNLLDAGNL